MHLAIGRRVPAKQVPGRVALGVTQTLDRRELDGLIVGDGARGPVAHDQLGRGREGGDCERHDHGHTYKPVAAPTQHGNGIDRRGHEAGNDDRRQEHVHQFMPEEPVEERGDRVDVAHHAIHLVKPHGVVHPPVDRDHKE